MGLTSALSFAARSLEVFSAGMQVAGNNVANANTPGYIREQIDIRSQYPTKAGNLIIGNGITATGIRQQIDKFLEKRLYSAHADAQGADTRAQIYQQLETSLQALGDRDLSSQLNEFVSRINDLLNQPESGANRQLVVQEGVELAQSISTFRRGIDNLRSTMGVEVKDLVSEANRLIDEIYSLNPKITSLESAGMLESDAGALRTQRYNALNRLAQIVPITTVEQPTGQMDVFLGSESLVLRSGVQHLRVESTVDRGTAIDNVLIGDSNTPLNGTQGALNGMLAGRDQILGGFIDQLDQLVSSFIFEFNKIHSSGQGTIGFTNVTGTVNASDASAPLNSAAAGLPFTPQHGSFEIRVRNNSTGLITTSTINVDLDGIGTDMSLDDLVTAINGGTDNLTADITSDGKLRLVADSGYEIQFANDSSGALAALGINTFFTGSSSQDIAINSRVSADNRLFAAAQGGGPSDGSNGVQLAAILDKAMSGLNGVSVDEFYDTLVSSIAQASASETALAAGAKGYRDALLSQRDQFSGVSLDEEVVQILKFQQSYQAAARFISTLDQLMTTLLQI